MTDKRRVLFIGEAATLAHVARPFVLAQALDRNLYDVTFACDPRYVELLGDMPFPWRPIRSRPSEQFISNLAAGRPLFDAATLRSYVADDLELLRECQPDLVVGDLRLSLAVSAPLTNTCYVSITNAYWSPYARRRFPLPELPLVRMLGIKTANILFQMVRPFAFAAHTLPLNRVRREHGLPSLGLNLCRIYTQADYTLYADVPELLPTRDLPKNHLYLGPILWSPAVESPPWWDKVPADRPIVYVTMGSSGESHLLHIVLESLAEMPVTVMAATAGRIHADKVPGNAFVADYLPGEEAASRSSLVICNGGSPTTQQALDAGTPVLGIASNMDQYLNMGCIQQAGAGELLRSCKTNVQNTRVSVAKMLGKPSYRENAARLADLFSHYRAQARFQLVVLRVLDQLKVKSNHLHSVEDHLEHVRSSVAPNEKERT